MDSVLNCAFIGCGNISQTKHLPLCREDPHLHIRALYDPVREKAAMCSKQFGTSDTYIAEEPGDIFQDDAVDVVFVATPNNTHAAYAIQALNAGKHVICEKPMAISPTEAEAMLEASRKNRRLLHISYQNPLHPSGTVCQASDVGRGTVSHLLCKSVCPASPCCPHMGDYHSA